ncbi:hypothetical protein ACLB2K_077252 [Fragaria x ananassa]
MWQVSPRLVGDCREVASQSALDWGLWLCPRLVGDCREVASQSALDWGLWLCGEAVRAWLGTVARWPVSSRLIGDCGYVAIRALAWLGTVARWPVSPLLIGDCGESVRAWLGTVARWRCGRWVASQSTLDWGDSLLSVAGCCLGESVRAWLGTVAMWRVNVCMGLGIAGWGSSCFAN